MPAIPVEAERLERELASIVSTFSGRVGYLIRDLTTGREVTRNADDAFPTASAIKLPIHTAFCAQVEAGRATWDATVTPPLAAAPRGSGILQYLTGPVSLTYRDLAWLMICLSDNLATNIVIDAMGVDRTNELLHQLIDPGMTLHGRIGSAASIAAGTMGTATPRALARHLVLLADEAVPGAAHTLAVARQQVFESGIPRYLSVPSDRPPPAVVAHKTGALPGIRTDVGLIETDCARIAVAIMTDGSDDTGYGFLHEGQSCIGLISRAVLAAWTDVPVASPGPR